MTFKYPSLQVAHRALLEIGREDLTKHIYLGKWHGFDEPVILIKTPVEDSELVVKAVAMAHQAVGHKVTLYVPGDGSAGFDCEDCLFESDYREPDMEEIRRACS